MGQGEGEVGWTETAAKQPHLSRARLVAHQKLNQWIELTQWRWLQLLTLVSVSYWAGELEVLDSLKPQAHSVTASPLPLPHTPLCPSFDSINECLFYFEFAASNLCNKLNCLQFPLVVIALTVLVVVVYILLVVVLHLLIHLLIAWKLRILKIWAAELERFLRLPNDLAAFDKRLPPPSALGRAIKLPKCSITQRKQQQQQQQQA